jgi:hypothetical protein
MDLAFILYDLDVKFKNARRKKLSVSYGAGLQHVFMWENKAFLGGQGPKVPPTLRREGRPPTAPKQITRPHNGEQQASGVGRCWHPGRGCLLALLHRPGLCLPAHLASSCGLLLEARGAQGGTRADERGCHEPRSSLSAASCQRHGCCEKQQRCVPGRLIVLSAPVSQREEWTVLTRCRTIEWSQPFGRIAGVGTMLPARTLQMADDCSQTLATGHWPVKTNWILEEAHNASFRRNFCRARVKYEG